MGAGLMLMRLLPAVVLLMGAGAAWADVIDGNWCHNDGRRFSIRGPEIVTPGGKTLAGNYSRHGFSYTAPAPEPGSGKTIVMALVNENTVRLRVGETVPGAGEEVWVRCAPSISRFEPRHRSAARSG
jgi:hypothetical protein